MKPVSEMNDFEFQRFVGCDRVTAQMMIMSEHVHFQLPDRPMHPNAKMSGGPEYVVKIDQEQHNQKVSAYLKRFTGPCAGFISSADYSNGYGTIEAGKPPFAVFASYPQGDKDGLEQSKRDQTSQ